MIVAVLLCPVRVQAQGIEFEATVDKTVIPIDEQLTYTLTIRGARDAQPALPEIDGFEVLGRSESTHFSLVNNQTQVIKSIGYALMPHQAGEFTIPAASLVYGGQTYYSRPVTVKVVKGKVAPPVVPQVPSQPPAPRGKPPAASQPQASEDAPSTPRLFVQTAVDKKEAYVNEQITLTIQLYCNRLQIDNLSYTPPPTVGFLEESLGKQRDYDKVADGLLYRVSEVTTAVFPISSGELTIGPAELKGDILVPVQRRRRGFFDDFFGEDFFLSSFERKPFSLSSKPIALKIKPLPKNGRPEDFGGAVGSFSLEVSAQPLTVKVGEPITVTMKVSGVGSIDSASPPVIKTGAGFRTYPPEVATKKKVTAGKIGGEKVFKQVIVPLEEGGTEIPAVSFSYFDPGPGKYRTEVKTPIPVMVEAAPVGDNVALVEAVVVPGGKERIKILKKDILYIKDSPGSLRRSGRPFYRNPFYWICHLAALALLCVVWVVQSRRERLRSDVIYARRVGASRAVRRRFKTARRWLKEGDAEKYYGEVHRALIRYLADKLGLPSGAADPETVRNKLSGKGVSPRILEELAVCFETCNRARFAPGQADRNEMTKFLKSLEKLIGQLEKIKMK